MPVRPILTAWAMLAATCGVTADARPAPPHAGEMSLPAIQALADSYVKSGKVPGIVIAIGRGDAPPTFVEAGTIAADPAAPKAGPDSLWRVYSMTKPITAMAAMMLVEQGKLRLDEPVGDLIPAFKAMRVLDAPQASLASHPAQHPITIRNLLTHSGGLIYQFLGPKLLDQEYQRLGLLGGRADAKASEAQPKTLAEFADRVASVPLVAEPGTEWHYSVGVDVLGRVIEVASGMPFERFVQTRLLDPLGMRSTFWTVPQADAGRLATLYGWAADKSYPVEPGATSVWLHPPLVPYGGSGLVSSARDYDRFLQMLAGEGSVDGVRVLKSETVRLAMSNLLPDGVRVSGGGTPNTDKAEGFGAGGWVYLADVPNGVRAETYGWFGAAGTIAFIDPKTRLRVTVMVNYAPAEKWPLYADVVRTLYAPAAARSDKHDHKQN